MFRLFKHKNVQYYVYEANSEATDVEWSADLLAEYVPGVDMRHFEGLIPEYDTPPEVIQLLEPDDECVVVAWEDDQARRLSAVEAVDDEE